MRVLKLPGCDQLFVEMLGGGENWILNRSFLKTVRHSVLREMPVPAWHMKCLPTLKFA